MPRSKVTVEAVFTKIEPAPPLPFADVPTGHWTYEAIRYVYENGLMAGNRRDPSSARTLPSPGASWSPSSGGRRAVPR